MTLTDKLDELERLIQNAQGLRAEYTSYSPGAEKMFALAIAIINLAPDLIAAARENERLREEYKYINPCAVRNISSRICELGTKSCIVKHFKRPELAAKETKE